MPDLDGGHFFLTALMPVKTDAVPRDNGVLTAPSHILREVLATLPTAIQSPACAASGTISPFAQCRRTHFARLFVLDQPAYNGRLSGQPILQAVRKTDLLVPQPKDCLTCPWLVVILDFDARPGEDDGGLASYATGLWHMMAPELSTIFRHCHGFDTVRSAADFADYLRACRIETTMSFNDYWPGTPRLPALSLGALAGIWAAMLLLLVMGAVLLLRGSAADLRWLWLGVPAAVLLATGLLYAFVVGRGARPFPTAPNSDLPSVLKALYVQERFTTFAASHQQDGPAALHDAFATFLSDVRPADVAAPTRRPGRMGG